MEVRKETKNLGTVIIKPVDRNTAKELIIKNHYSHKWNSASFGKYNFGIFKEESPDLCLGVASYGYMKNCKAKIFSHPNPDAWMCELNRMWIDDCFGHNAETLLIGASLRLLRKSDPNIVAVQSFADGRLGCGTIYKAANFKYYGYHYTRFVENTRTGEIIHEQILTNTTSTSGYLRANIAYLIGDTKTFEVKTYRYIYPFCKHFKFKTPEKPYPEYDKGLKPVEWVRDCTKIKENIVYLLSKV
ncbi:hypothetical protein D0T53_09485 [Dysgonomonas sp. 216]|uniref:Mom family adenine methylcarbamoylation protein n=1 Tax=Dysgonomonas sp. 216 TaxID=2302934 RepID=UPI0013D33674|nr:hypothetical protein [Dysgonomonas sp. 216]NDW19142.1 hypothetical protein [Dysgonomonas sp. 216]